MMSQRNLPTQTRIQNPKSKISNGYTLLEVILALAIFTGALAVLGELVRNGTRSAQVARDLSTAAVICEGKLGEIVAGLMPAGGVKQAPIAEYPGWLLTVENDASVLPVSNSIATSSTGSSSTGAGSQAATQNQASLLKLRITVEQSADAQNRPVRFTVTRWVRDPATTGKATYTPPSAYYDSTGTITQSTSSQGGSNQGQSTR